MKKLLVVIIILLSTLSIFSLIYIYKLKTNKTPESERKPISTEQKATPTPTASTENTSPATVQEGFINGKLCYPSDFLPKGSIVAKNVLTEALYTQNYIGSSQGGANTYTFKLPEGQYYLKYVAKPNPNSEKTISGYYTEQCSTGSDKDCNKEERTNKVVAVKSNEATSGVNLCDFYYTQNSEPTF
ncbi:hypothetical protein A3K42_01070 [candidate division WWE3 bacterium RBG_13_37_7]|uniref:Uncharacterized protein n=1 Tax=candidate division WWE3 bacterium RBG_13_37_7 TaxID=1802609 RepID=A0A1F4U2B3_UNCKA|nr:MAG: hypothetical protein A3K42_01070 [candidate division WWE3 bacterium RBG_13_37_7]